MDSSNPEVAYEFLPLLKVYKDGRVERLIGNDTVPPSTDPITGVASKDIAITQDVSARLYLPKRTTPSRKLPIVVYFHGGAFCVSSPSTTKYHRYLNAIVSEANVVAVSVDYRKAPEHPIPTAYEDSWVALQWVASHNCENGGPEPWLNEHADFEKLFLAGDSAGANIAHNLAIVAGDPEFELGSSILGMALVHPYFWGSDPIGSEALDPLRKESVDRLWPFICPTNPDNDDPRVNPMAKAAPSLVGLGYRRLLVCVAEKDVLRDRGRLYYEALGRSGWMGVVEIMETEGRDHAFHLNNPEDEKARDVIRGLVDFFSRDMPPLL